MKQEQAANTDDNELSLVPDPFLVVSCPFLGVRDDPGTPMGFPTPGNQCYAFEPALHVDLEKQSGHCLSDCYSDCLYFQQQMTYLPEEKGGRSRASSFLRRVVNGRTLALMMMLLLILLAVLIWWPPPGTSTEEGTVFGVSFTLNSPNVESESTETAGQPVASQEKSGAEESIPAANPGENAGDVQQSDPIVETNKKDDEAKRPDSRAQSAGQGATLNSPSVGGVEAVLEEPNSPPVVQHAAPVAEKVVEDKPATAPETTAVEEMPAIEEKVEEKAAPAAVPAAVESEPVPEIASSDLPEDEQKDQPPVADSGDSTREKSAFSPIDYGDQVSDNETLNVYQNPDSSHYIRITRPELFNLLGRDNTAEWIKISTESGIEGWVLVSETELGSWVESLPEIEP